MSFVSQAAIEAGVPERSALRAALRPCATRRAIGKRDMMHNAGTPKIEVDPADLRGARRRRAADVRAGERVADGAPLFPVLIRR